jgi:hypothetical protein
MNHSDAEPSNASRTHIGRIHRHPDGNSDTSEPVALPASLKQAVMKSPKTTILGTAPSTFLVAILATFLLTMAASADQTVSPFIAEGTVSWQGFDESPTNIVAVSKTEGKFLFSYSNDVWQVQFVYQTNYCSLVPMGQNITGAMIDVRSIPDGIREIDTFPANPAAPSVDKNDVHPSAIATTNRFPEWVSQEVFLPWLSLCPQPKLPFVNSNLMRIHFDREVLDNPKNKGRFQLTYLEPEKQFLQELSVTNPGMLFLADGGTRDLPYPYKNGYCQFAYKVVETTNCGGLVFPFISTLYQFTPSSAKPLGKLYPAVISQLQITRIDIYGRELRLAQVPYDLVALDRRPTGLVNDVTVNYDVINDQWPSTTNGRLKRIAQMVRRESAKLPEHNEEYGRKRLIIITILAALTIVMLIASVLCSKTPRKHQPT